MIYTLKTAVGIYLQKLCHVKNLISPLCYFSAEGSEFVKNARTLEKLKTSATFPESAYENGKYILMFRNELVCLEKGGKLVWRDVKGQIFTNHMIKIVFCGNVLLM